MPKSRITGNQKQQIFPLDPAYSHTIDIANMSLIEDDVDDNDICPVCDGECTCGPPPSSSTALSPPRLTPVAVVALSPNLNPNGDGPAPTPAAAPRPHPLKIKLTVPANMLTKNTTGSPPASKPSHKLPKFKKFKHLISDQDAAAAAASQPHYQDHSSSTSSIAVAGPSSHHQSTPFAVAMSKKKGSTSHHGHKNNTSSHHHHPTSTHSKPSKSSLLSNRRDISPSASYYPQYGMAMQARKDALTRKARALKAKNTAVKKFAAAKKKKTKRARKPMPWDVNDSEDDSHNNVFQSGLFSDEDDDLIPYGGNNNDNNDGHLDHLPTFMPASALSSESEASISSLSELTSEESDASVVAEEETFIVQQEERRPHDKARVRRELLGDDAPRHTLQNNNNWIIRPRQKSVGLSDVDMDTDSETTEEDELQNDDQDMLGGDDDDDDEDEGEAADGDGESDREEPRARYVGLATGWSDDEESSFDADLFFANLSDSSAHDSSSSDCAADDDGYQTDIGSVVAANELRSEGLEIAQGWDGQIVFTTASAPHGHGVLDFDFEARAAALAGADADADIEASDDVVMTDYYEGDEDDVDDLDDDVAFDDDGCSDGGDTTDDELVDEHNRPTARALALFRWPASVSTINPLVIASPSASPAPRVNRSTMSGSIDDDNIDSPIAGKRGHFFSFSVDDFAEPDESSFAKQNRGPPSVGGFPSRGSFTATSETSAERIIIDRKTPGPLPLPYRLVRGRTRPRAYSSSTNNSDFDIRGRSLSLSRSHHHPLSLSISSITEEHIAPSDDAASLPATSIDLDDVLHSSVLEAGPQEAMTSSYLSSEPEARDALNNHNHTIATTIAAANNNNNNNNNACPDLDRWDHIPVDTFRRAREAGGDTAAGAATTEGVTESFSAMSVMKSPYPKQEGPFALRPPFGTALYHNRAAARMRRARARQAPGTPTPTSKMMIPGRMNNKMVLSPMLLPLRGSGGDGDVTPTTLGGGSGSVQLEMMSSGGSSNKTRKELRREKKMKRKALAPAGTAHRNPYPHQHHHQQHHHFNHHHHQHYPNMKSRSTGAVQRMGSMGAPPPLNL